ncbi:hypothetical protein ACOSQ3_005024 [Xanthoceras sorbifolium]
MNNRTLPLPLDHITTAKNKAQQRVKHTDIIHQKLHSSCGISLHNNFLEPKIPSQQNPPVHSPKFNLNHTSYTSVRSRTNHPNTIFITDNPTIRNSAKITYSTSINI